MLNEDTPFAMLLSAGCLNWFSILYRG